MKRQPSWVWAVLAAGWLLLVIGGVRGVQIGLEAWGRQSLDLERSRELLRRYQGWAEAEPQIAAARDRVMGPFAQLKQKEAGWVALERFQKTTQELGIAVAELRPTRLPARAGQPALFRLDAKVKGTSGSLTALLRQLPDRIPGILLEQIQVTPAEEGRLQLLVRFSFGAPV